MKEAAALKEAAPLKEAAAMKVSKANLEAAKVKQHCGAPPEKFLENVGDFPLGGAWKRLASTWLRRCALETDTPAVRWLGR